MIEIAKPIEIAAIEQPTVVDGETITPAPMSGWTPDMTAVAEADEATRTMLGGLRTSVGEYYQANNALFTITTFEP